MDKEIDKMMDLLITREKNLRQKHSCLRCNKSWFSKKKSGKPKMCMYCKSTYWNVPRRKDTITYFGELFK